MKPSEALIAHRAELRQLVSRYGLSHPRVFGSVLSGTDTDESDLDLLVDPAESTSLLTIAGLKIDAEELLGVPVCVCVNSEWIAAEISQPGVATGPASMKHPDESPFYARMRPRNHRPTVILRGATRRGGSRSRRTPIVSKNAEESFTQV